MAEKPTKHPGGRPTKYKAEFCQELINYFDIEPYEEREIPHYKGNGKNREVAWTDYKRMPNKWPTLRGFAKSIDVGIRTVYDWLDEKHGSFQSEFSHAFTQAQELRKDFLTTNGLEGLYNPLFAKFVAINVTDMSDRKEVDLGDKTLGSLADVAAMFAAGGGDG